MRAPLRLVFSVALAFATMAVSQGTPAAADSGLCGPLLVGAQRLNISNALFLQYEPYHYKNGRPRTGVEVEGYIAKGTLGEDAAAVRRALAERATKFLSDAIQPAGGVLLPTRFDDHVHTLSYEHRNSNQHMPIEVKSDLSLTDRGDAIGVEITSPPMATDQDYEIFDHVLTGMQSLGFHAIPKVAGLHVHIDVPGVTAAEVGILLHLFSKIDFELRETFSVAVGRGLHIFPLSDDMRRYLRVSAPDGLDLDLMHDKQEDKAVSLNMRSIAEHGSIELRIFNSTLDRRTQKFVRDFAVALITKVRSKDSGLKNLLMRFDDKKVLPLAALWPVLGLSQSEIDHAAATFERELANPQ